MEKIDITQKLADFQEHLEHNPRTIFSARFGDGKTYFLREYFAKHQIWQDYTPIKDREGSAEDTYFVVLHPVNYSVAKNEDVFEYIKRDILIQLYQEGKIDNIDYKCILKSIGEALKEKALPMLGEMAALVPGGNIAKAFIDCGVEVKQRYNEAKKTASDFMDTFVKQRGGIYENDAYTKLISSTLKHLNDPKNGLPARKVLVIEDLDRLDPGHLFRILNVLGAHIDDDKDTNKFGFDNIVLVMDYDITEHIFHHFYGMEASYTGYMDKFITQNPYRYSIKELAQQQLMQKMRDLAGERVLNVLVDGSRRSIGSVSLRDRIQQLSVRRVEHILDNLESMITQSYVDVNGLRLSTKTPLTYLLALLTLMNETYKRPSIMESLESKEWLEFIGPLVYAEERLLYNPVEFERGRYDILARKKDGIITNVSHRLSAAAQEVVAEQRADVVHKAFVLAQEVVRDAKGIRLIP